MYPIDYLWRSAERNPSAVAIAEPNRIITYRQLANAVTARAIRLCELDPTKGSRVCIGAANSPDHLIAILAVLAAGKVWVPLNPRNGDPELARAVEFARPGLVLLDDAMAARLRQISAKLVRLEELADIVEPAKSFRQPENSLPLDHAQAMKFTGGTTGMPKGVIQPYRSWVTNIATQIHELGLNTSDRYLVAAPITHGTSTYILPTLGTGGSLFFPSSNKAEALLEAIEKFDITLFFAPPTLLLALMEEQIGSPRRLNKLRLVIYGGAPMATDKIQKAQSVFGPIVCTTYGQTEAPQIATFMPASKLAGERLGSVGRASLLTRVAVLDGQGRPAPANEMGEIAIRGDLVMGGYFEAPEATAATIRDGWLRTGDLGVLDEEGFLFIRGRSRDVIITGGFNVYPIDVEAVLAAQPGVVDCAVVGIPDERWGEAVRALVNRREGETLNEDSLIASIKRELGSVKAPKSIHFMSEIPKTPVGKHDTVAIRAEIERQLMVAEQKQ